MIILVSLLIFFTTTLCTVVHIKAIKITKPLNLYFSCIVLLISHIAHIFLFAFMYFIFIDYYGLELVFIDGTSYSFINYVYYSASVYTALGFGDVYPLGLLKIAAAIQPIFGLAMIAFSASLIFTKISSDY